MAKISDVQKSLSKTRSISDLIAKNQPWSISQLPLRIPVVRNPILENIQENLASEFYKKLVQWINEFDANLDNAHEVGVRLVSFGQTIVFHLDDVGYWDPSLIQFNGKTEEGQPVKLIQHVSQISILLMKLPREDPIAPKKPIGFHTEIDPNDSETNRSDL